MFSHQFSEILICGDFHFFGPNNQKIEEKFILNFLFQNLQAEILNVLLVLQNLHKIFFIVRHQNVVDQNYLAHFSHFHIFLNLWKKFIDFCFREIWVDFRVKRDNLQFLENFLVGLKFLKIFDLLFENFKFFFFAFFLEIAFSFFYWDVFFEQSFDEIFVFFEHFVSPQLKFFRSEFFHVYIISQINLFTIINFWNI